MRIHQGRATDLSHWDLKSEFEPEGSVTSLSQQQLYMCVCICICIYIYKIYTCTERERERERETFLMCVLCTSYTIYLFFSHDLRFSGIGAYVSCLSCNQNTFWSHISLFFSSQFLHYLGHRRLRVVPELESEQRRETDASCR